MIRQSSSQSLIKPFHQSIQLQLFIYIKQIFRNHQFMITPFMPPVHATFSIFTHTFPTSRAGWERWNRVYLEHDVRIKTSSWIFLFFCVRATCSTLYAHTHTLSLVLRTSCSRLTRFHLSQLTLHVYGTQQIGEFQ